MGTPPQNIFFEETNQMFPGDEAGRRDKGNQLPPISSQVLPMFTAGRKFFAIEWLHRRRIQALCIEAGAADDHPQAGLRRAPVGDERDVV